MSFSRRFIAHSLPLFTLLFLAQGIPASSQVTGSESQVVETPTGPLEFIGLKTWTAQQLWDSIAALTPGASAHACMAVLRNHFGFEDALVAAFPDENNLRWVAFVSEGKDGEDPFFYTSPSTSYPLNKTEKQLDSLFSTWRFLSQIAISSYPYYLKGDIEGAHAVRRSWGADIRRLGAGDEIDGVDSSTVEYVWSIWNQMHSPEGKEAIFHTLSHNGNDTARRLAVLSLVNFHDDVSIRWKLVELLRDPDQMVAGNAGTVLLTLDHHFRMSHNWDPVLPTLRRILSGEGSGNLLTVMQLLRPDGDTALGGNEDFILAMLSSYTPDIRRVAHEFLKTLSGEDFGMDSKAWRKWIQAEREE